MSYVRYLKERVSALFNRANGASAKVARRGKPFPLYVVRLTFLLSHA